MLNRAFLAFIAITGFFLQVHQFECIFEADTEFTI